MKSLFDQHDIKNLIDAMCVAIFIDKRKKHRFDTENTIKDINDRQSASRIFIEYLFSEHLFQYCISFFDSEMIGIYFDRFVHSINF